ncbi:MAG: hypothetical protein HY000_09905 [Planctomycetes bacterium]|nr:hypothetical protein [Planctomycetota bacterium]
MFWIHPRYQDMLAAAATDSYEAVLKLPARDHFVEKQGRSTGRYTIAGSNESVSVYLKKYFRIPWWQRFLMPAARFPGPRELANIERVAALGIAVPKPVIAGADRNHPCKSMLAVRELEGYVPLHEFIPARFVGPETDDRLLRRQLTHRLAAIVRKLHAANLYHLDLYLCHFFIRQSPEDPARLDLVLIDLMRLKHSRLSRWRIKDLAQLQFSSDLPAITRTDRLRFFKLYLGLRRLDAPAHRLLRKVQRKAAMYHRHNDTLARRAAA